MKFFVVLAMVLLVVMIAVGVKTRGGEEARTDASPAALPLVPGPAPTPIQKAVKKPPPPAATPSPTPAAPPAASPTATSTPPLAPPAAFQAFSIEADDAAFYPATITVHRDTVISLTFKVRAAGVYGGGLDIRSSYFDSGSVAAGGIKTVTFKSPARPETITFSSFAQGTGNKKAEGTVVVE